MESPTNPRMQVIDIKGIAEAARAAGAYSLVDNSIMAPIYQQTLALGVGDCLPSGGIARPSLRRPPIASRPLAIVARRC